MSAALIFPPLQFPCNSAVIPKFLLFSKPFRANLATNSDETTTAIDDEIKSSESRAEKSSLSSKVSPISTSMLKAPTAPWMKGPLLVEPNQVLDLSKTKTKKRATFGKTEAPDKFLRKVGAGRGKREMKKIFRGIEKLQHRRNSGEVQRGPEKVKFNFSPGELWGDGVSGSEDEEEVFFEKEPKLGSQQKRMELFEFGVSKGEVEGGGKPMVGRKMPWDRDKKLGFARVKERVVTAAELNLDEELLKRLRNEAAKMRKWVKVMKAGVTQDVVDQVNLIWKDNELTMLKFYLPLSRNMERAREIVEV